MVLPPVAIVWACGLSVDEYVAAGRAVVVPRAICPSCSTAMAFWSGYERSIRHRGPALKLWVRRARCASCQASHALLPSFCLLGRLDAVEVIGSALGAVVVDSHGVRPVAASADVPHTTARDWVRRLCRRAELVAAAFAALVVELTGLAPPTPVAQAVAGHALELIHMAFAAVRSRAGPVLPSLWGFAAAVTGGRLLGTNTDPLSTVLGSRRLMPPVP